ncbi:hypothetical protein WJX81_007592 [Elliptochloris bilobata]|uniref:Thioredoxin domain-containing protein n=1 Tax=Elliptochloris bilobata TaxID=381761 RepID=A0AAW1RHA8_9CHLO
MGKTLQKLQKLDFFRKIPTDLTEATFAGASISLFAAVSIILLLGMELSSFLRVQTSSEMVVDRSAQGDLLRISFNISFPSLSCEFATLDVSDALGTKRLNLTKTIRKLPIGQDLNRAGYYQHEDVSALHIEYDAFGAHNMSDAEYSTPITHDHFKETLSSYSISVINFYAPWCHWCQRLEPTWEKVAQEVHKRYPEGDGRLRFAKVDCVAEQAMCQEHQVAGYPSIRVFRAGHDEINLHGVKDHEAYIGDRTYDSLLAFAENLAVSAGQPHHYVRGVTRMAKTSGCALSGFVLVKKVPGSMHFLAKSPSHTFDYSTQNLSHVVNYFYFGSKPSPRRRAELEKLHPAGLTDDWADKLAGHEFYSHNQKATFEHYLQVVRTTIEPAHRPRENSYDAYEYTAHSHTYNSFEIPSAKFSYALSPVQIIVAEQRRAWYHFVTTTCAVVGGVFTVAGICDGIFHTSVKLTKKLELGKQT